MKYYFIDTYPETKTRVQEFEDIDELRDCVTKLLLDETLTEIARRYRVVHGTEKAIKVTFVK